MPSAPTIQDHPPYSFDEYCPAAEIKGAVQGLLFSLADPSSDIFLPAAGMEREHAVFLAALDQFDQDSGDGKVGRVAAWDGLLAAGAAFFARMNDQVRLRLAELDAWHQAATESPE